MSLAEQNAARAKKVIAGVGVHIQSLADIAEQVKLPSVAKVLRDQKAALAEDTFKLPVLGRFRNGKSTFLNSLLCEIASANPDINGRGPLPADTLPTTAILTTINYGPSPMVTVERFDGRNEEWSLSRFQKESVIRRNPEENQEFFKEIREFKLRYPSETLKSGITLLDTPGTDDIGERTEIVQALIHQVDAAIVVLRSDSLGGQEERNFIMSLKLAELHDLFFVINRREGRMVDDDLQAEAWYRIADMCLGKGRYAGQNLADHNIFFVDAKAGLEGRLNRDPAKLAASGLDAFERRLSDYLERNKRPAHVKRFVQGADAQGRAIDDAIGKLIPTIKTKADEFRARLQALQPQLNDIRSRVAALPGKIKSYRSRAEDKLRISFQDMINSLCADLESELKKKPIPSIDKISVIDRVTLPFWKKTVQKETLAAAQEIFEERVTAWRKNPPDKPGAAALLGQLFQEMIDDIVAEVTRIQRKFEVIQFELVGFAPDVDATKETAGSWVGNIVVGAVSLIAPDHAYGYQARGWGGVFSSILVHAATWSVVLFLGGPAGWAVAAGTLASIVWTAFTAPEKLKEMYRKQVCEKMIPKIRELPATAAPAITAGIADIFAKFEEGLMKAVKQEVAKEEDTINEQMEMATKNADEKRRLLEVLERYRAEVSKCREGLQNTLIAVQSATL